MPSCSPFRCFVVLLLVAAAGLLARPAEASKRLFAGIVDAAGHGLSGTGGGAHHGGSEAPPCQA